ncbi:MAG: CshA/CshB family fibrillar adhesin-related protein, partial [Nocardioides sp.]
MSTVPVPVSAPGHVLGYRGRRLLVGLVVLGLVLMGVATAVPARADVATGGAGRLIDAVQWFSWGANDEPIPDSGITKTNTFIVAGQPLEMTCSLSNIADANPGAPAGTVLSAYRSGDWVGDGFDDLYNVGGVGPDNQLAVAVRNQSGREATFDFSCSATFGGNPFPLEGLVFADAESTNINEFIAATAPASATWRIVDRYRNENFPGCTQHTVLGTVSSANRFTLRSTGECNEGAPMAVAFLDGATSATNVAVKGNGEEAIALGVVISIDRGDAPASYGDAAHSFSYGFTGGEVPVDTPNVPLSTPPFALADIDMPQTRLGAIVDPETGPFADSDATGDDVQESPLTAGVNDEDGITAPSAITTPPGATYTVPGVACTGPGTVAGWVDFDADGTFSAAEGSAPAPCSGSSVDLSWTVPTSVVMTPTPSYLRLRIAPTAAGVASPTGVVIGGEVEDYRVQIDIPKPEATDDADVTPYETPVTVDLLGNDSPVTGYPFDPASVRLIDPATGNPATTVTTAAGVYVVDPATGGVTFTPATGFQGATPAVDYQVADSAGQIARAALVITVGGPPPTATADTGTTPQNVDVTVDPLANDTPADGGPALDPASVKLLDPATDTYGTTVTIPGEGTYTVNPDGSVTFTPEPGFTGAAAPVTYQVADTDGGTDTATVTVTVTPVVPVAPTAVDDTGTTPAETPVTVPLLTNDTPADGGPALDPASV